MGALIPRSKAKRAYGLLGEVKRLILDEPKRYDQQDWLNKGVTGELAPACGTVGCVAGWVHAMKRRGVSDVCDSASTILGFMGQDGLYFETDEMDGWDMSEELFSAYACRGTFPQTDEHAKAGADHIERFRQKYAKQLKAKRV